MCKLYENCFRVVNIAYTNEIADICHNWDININEMITACESKPYGFMPFFPGLGVGGHCLPYNPYYLMKGGVNLPILKKSATFLEMRPYIKATELINKHDFNKVLVIGVGFKPDISFIEFIDLDDFNVDYINDNFNIVVVAIKQSKIDYSILESLKESINVIYF